MSPAGENVYAHASAADHVELAKALLAGAESFHPRLDDAALAALLIAQARVHAALAHVGLLARQLAQSGPQGPTWDEEWENLYGGI